MLNLFRKKNKYGARKTGAYDSRKEARRAADLRVMERAGLIRNLREQVKFELIPSQYREGPPDPKGRPTRELVERSVSYIADFVYERDGATVVEDVKGKRTDVYILKRKLMFYRYGIQILET